MTRAWLAAGAGLLALSSSLAFAAPESLLPPSFQDPPEETPTPSPSPTPTPTVQATQAAPTPGATQTPTPGSTPVVQDVPGAGSSPASRPRTALPEGFPSLAELEAMEEDQLDEVLGLRPQFDIPPAARRAVQRVGVISSAEGGFPSQSLAGQPAALIRAALEGTRGPLVSRWGHILMRRALASRLDAPEGMDAVEFAAMRAALLNRMGEGYVARYLVQDIDSDNYTRALADAAFASYLSTGDLLGMCPVAEIRGTLRDDPEWEMMQAVCDSYSGDTRSAERRLDRALGTGQAPAIDVLLAQRFAGAAGEGRRAVTIEWDEVNELSPWRYGLSRALGVDIPESLLASEADYEFSDALMPALPPAQRLAAADRAASRGLMSSAALVDLYSQAWAADEIAAPLRDAARTLREAYVVGDAADRMAAMRILWGDTPEYGRQVLTAYAAARMPVDEALLQDAPDLIASMLTAGLDRNALRWGEIVSEGSLAWGMLALAQPQRNSPVDDGAVDTFIDDDQSSGQRKSQFLLAGLAGLGRIDPADAADFSDRLGINLAVSSDWSRRIERAGELGNPTLVALLAGVGMQGTGWDRMTARHLFQIVRALDRAGLSAEARMIAAEAVARG